MTRVSVDEIQQDVVQTGKPIAEIKLVVGPPQGVRPFGLCAGECTVPEDFRCALTRGRH